MSKKSILEKKGQLHLVETIIHPLDQRKASCIFSFFSFIALISAVSFSNCLFLSYSALSLSSQSSSSSHISTCMDFLTLLSSSLVRQLPIFLRTSLYSSIALNIFCAVASLIEAAITSCDAFPCIVSSWNTSS